MSWLDPEPGSLQIVYVRVASATLAAQGYAVGDPDGDGLVDLEVIVGLTDWRVASGWRLRRPYLLARNIYEPTIVACWALFVVFGGVVSAQRGLPPIDIRGVEPLQFGEVVRGAPFSAEAMTEMTQELRDGNRIEQRSTVVIARDGAGRTRREQALPPIGPVIPDHTCA